MRIECEVCSATYTIDDAQLSDQPIGAQCPYCGHVKLVRKGDAGPSSARVSPGSYGFDSSGGGDPFQRGSQLPAAKGPPNRSLADDLASPSYGGATSVSGPPPGMGDATCQVCGTPLTDEFDKVIGLCDVHQREKKSSDLDQPSPIDAWYVRTKEGRQVGPLMLEELRNRIRQAEFTPQDNFSQDGVTWNAMSRFKEIAYLASLAALPGETGTGGGRRAQSASLDLGRLITPIVVVLVAAGIAFLGYANRDLVARVWAGLERGAGGGGPSGPNPLKRYLAQWRLSHPDVSGSASEHLVAARSQHLEDTWRGYQQAEKSLQRALLLDEEDAEAIAAYVENLAVWRGHLAPPEELEIAAQAAEYATALAPETPGPHRAQAILALVTNDLDGCRRGAEKAAQLSATDGRAKLILSGCYLEGNVGLSINEAERARQLLPELRRATRVLAEAYAKAGRFKSALGVLDERLKSDPENAATHLLYGDILRSLGEFEEAEAHFRRAATNPEGDYGRALLTLGELSLERGDSATAITHFSNAATKSGALFGKRAAEIYAGWARAELARNRAARAAKLADRALEAQPKDLSALLVRGHAALLAGSATTAAVYARRALDGRDREGEPAGLVLAAQADAELRARDQAVKRLELAMANDPRDVRLKGILAALFLKSGDSSQAYSLMRQAAEIDPLEAFARNRLGPISVAELAVRDAIAQFRKSASEERDASVASSSMAMLYYALGDQDRARAAVDRALRLDNANVAALVYEAQLAIDRGDATKGAQVARQLLGVEKGSSLGHLLLARALKVKKQVDEAQQHYEDALRSNPGLLTAKVELASLRLEGNSRNASLEVLRSAFTVKPDDITLRRILWEAGI